MKIKKSTNRIIESLGENFYFLSYLIIVLFVITLIMNLVILNDIQKIQTILTN